MSLLCRSVFPDVSKNQFRDSNDVDFLVHLVSDSGVPPPVAVAACGVLARTDAAFLVAHTAGYYEDGQDVVIGMYIGCNKH